MKQEARKKSKLWIWLIAGIVLLLAIAGVVLALVLGGGESTPDGPQGGRAELYWNVDKTFYTANSESGLSTRQPGEDGVYRIRFAYNGELVELPVADKQLVNFIDTMDCMGIVQDADGTVIDAVDPKTLATETARMFYVRKVNGDTITLNSSMAMNGMSMDIPVVDVTEIYEVTEGAQNLGQIIQPDALEAMDSVTVYSNDLGEATHIYLVSHPVESPVYWRADTGTYDSTAKKTTRVPDAEGYYTIPFYVNGEYVELKCKDAAIVNTIDAKNRFKAHTGLVLDENGYIVDNMLSATGIRGMLGCEMYDVTAVDGKNFTAEALISGSGEIYTNTLTDDAVIYDVSLTAAPELRGKATDSLQLGDRVVVFENAEGEAVLVWVAQRMVDSPMYFNVTRKYSSTTKETTRTPDANGWYYIDLMADGEIKTYKTKDKAIVTYIDSQSNRGVGLLLDGDVIVQVYPGETVAGYGAYVGYTIKSVTGSIISAYPISGEENTKNMILHPDCKVYNMSGVRQEKGELTTLQPNDYCIMWRNAKSEIVYVYVIRRPVDVPVYFSLTRKWDSTTQQTTRVPDANGWYIYECACEGKLVTAKTKDKSVANFLDSQSPQSFGLEVNSSGVIIEAFETTNVTGGNKAYLNTLVKRLDVLVLYNPTTEKVYTPKLAEDCEIYNMSAVVEKHKGEKTTLQLNDSVQCYTNSKGEIVLIYVRIRKVDADVYFSKHRVKEVTADGKTARQPDADGWYVFECAKDGKEVTVKTKDIDIATFMDAQSPQSFALKVDKNGVIQKAYATTAATGGNTRAVNAVVQSVDGDKVVVKLTNGDEYEMPMASSYKVYNVSSNYDDHFGEATKIKVGDTLQSYTNSSGKVSLVFVRVRGGSTASENSEPKKSYWNVNRQYDKENKVSLRTPDADGYYYIDLAVDGQIKTFKTKSQDAINYADASSGAIALTLAEPGSLEFTKAQSALYVYGVEAAGVSGTVKAIEGNKVTLTTGTIHTMAAGVAVYDVSGKGDFIGQATELKVGDKYRCYVDENGEILYIYVLTRAEEPEPEIQYSNENLSFQEGTTKAECTYCGEVVEWTALEQIDATFTLEDGKHYYLAQSITDNTSWYNVAKNAKNCVHLNGNSVTSTKRVFTVSNDGTLTIIGNGTVTGSDSPTTANVAAATISCRGSLNLIGGTYKHTGSTMPTIIMSRPQKTLCMYEGVTLEGTEGVTGSNLFVAYGIFNMYGGTITGGTAAEGDSTGGVGGNLCLLGTDSAGTVSARAEANIYGGTIDGGVYAYKRSNSYLFTVSGDVTISGKDGGVTLANEAVITLGELGENAKIYVTGDGAVTGQSDNAAAYVNTKILPASSNITLAAQDNVIVATVEQPIDPEPTPEPVWKMAWVVDPQYDATDKVTTRTPDADGYYVVDLSIDGQIQTYKTKATGLSGGIDYVDQSGNSNRAISVCLTEEGSLEFTKALAGTNNTGATGAAVCTITAIDADAVTGLDKNNATFEGTVPADAKIFDVSDQAAVEGELTTLKVGDYCRFYTGENNAILYAYVYTRADVTPEPEPEDVEMNTVKEKADGMASVFAEANGAEVEAQCPACGKSVTWKALPAVATSKVTLESGHYYAAADSDGMSSYLNIVSGVEVCVHLNGKTLSSDDERVFYVDSAAKLTVMGSGNVIGGRKLSTAAERCGSAIEATGEDTVVNLCGGTWTKSRNDLDVVGSRIRGEGGINIYDGTVINGTEGIEGYELWVSGGNVNLYGGEINGDVYARLYKAATATVVYAIDLNLAGTTVNGKVVPDSSVAGDFTVTLSGDSVIGELVADSALPVQIGRMLPGADVKVTAEGPFTAENANAQDYVDDGFLSAKAEGKTLTVTDGIISCVDVPVNALNSIDNSSISAKFEAGTTKAVCPYCGGEAVEWEVLPEIEENYTFEDGKHYYLAASINNTAQYTVSAGVEACVHLNDCDITCSKRVFVVSAGSSGSGTLNVMGQGVVTGGTERADYSATVEVSGAVNLLGGTYQHAITTSGPTIVVKRTFVEGKEGHLRIYAGAKITAAEGATGPNVYVRFGQVDMYGGIISGGTATAEDIAMTDGGTGMGGNVLLTGYSGAARNAVFNMYGGSITGGTAVQGANVAVLSIGESVGVFNMYGGNVDGGVYVDEKGIVSVAGNAVVTEKDGGITLNSLLTLGRLTKGAEIYITAADGAITAENARAAAYLEYGYIKAAVEGKTVTEKDGVLSIG